MAAENIQIKVEPRTAGKHFSRTLRKEKRIPAVVYGPRMKNTNVWVNEVELEKYNRQKFENAIFVFKSSSKDLDSIQALKKNVDFHPLTRRPVHLDFFAIDMTKAIRVEVEVIFQGKAAGIKEGGVLSVARREIEVECLPTNIPESFIVDVTPLGLDDTLHVSDVAIPEGIKVITPANETLCSVAEVEEVKETPVEAVAAEGAEAPTAEGEAKEAAAPAADKEKKEKKE